MLTIQIYHLLLKTRLDSLSHGLGLVMEMAPIGIGFKQVWNL